MTIDTTSGLANHNRRGRLRSELGAGRLTDDEWHDFKQRMMAQARLERSAAIYALLQKLFRRRGRERPGQRLNRGSTRAEQNILAAATDDRPLTGKHRKRECWT